TLADHESAQRADRIFAVLLRILDAAGDLTQNEIDRALRIRFADVALGGNALNEFMLAHKIRPFTETGAPSNGALTWHKESSHGGQLGKRRFSRFLGPWRICAQLLR